MKLIEDYQLNMMPIEEEFTPIADPGSKSDLRKSATMTPEQKLKSEYAVLKRDVLGDGIKESKLSAIQDLYLKLYKAAHPEEESGILPGYILGDSSFNGEDDIEKVRAFFWTVRSYGKAFPEGWDKFINDLPADPSELNPTTLAKIEHFELWSNYSEGKIINDFHDVKNNNDFFLLFLYGIKLAMTLCAIESLPSAVAGLCGEYMQQALELLWDSMPFDLYGAYDTEEVTISLPEDYNGLALGYFAFTLAYNGEFSEVTLPDAPSINLPSNGKNYVLYTEVMSDKVRLYKIWDVDDNHLWKNNPIYGWNKIR